MEGRYRSGQVGIEYLILVGFLVAAVIPIIYYATQQSYITKDQLISSQMEKIAQEIENACNLVFSYGNNSKLTLKLYFPEGIKSIKISGKQVEFVYYTSSGEAFVYSYPLVNLSGNISTLPGLHEIKIVNKGDHVEISG